MLLLFTLLVVGSIAALTSHLLVTMSQSRQGASVNSLANRVFSVDSPMTTLFFPSLIMISVVKEGLNSAKTQSRIYEKSFHNYLSEGNDSHDQQW